MSFKASIKFRIILLSVVGMIGMCVIAGANKYLDSINSIQINIREKSQEVAKCVLNSSLIEEQFRANPSQSLIDQHDNNKKIISSAVKDIESLTTSDAVNSLLGQIVKVLQHHNENFTTLASNSFEMKQAQVDMMAKITSIVDILMNHLADFNKEEALLMIEGELLDGAKSTLKGEFKDIKGYLDSSQIVIHELFLSNNGEEYQKNKNIIKSKIDLKVSNITEIIKSISSEGAEEIKKSWEGVTKELTAIDTLNQKLFSLWENNQSLTKELAKTSAEMQSSATKITESIKTEMTDQNQKAEIFCLSVAAGGIAILLLFSIIIVRAIVSPLNNTVSMLKDIAQGEGDLTKRLKVDSKDEIGEMATWFNIFVEKIQIIMTDVADNAKKLNGASINLSKISDHLSTGAEQTNIKAETVATAGEEMHSNMSSVAAAMEEASVNINMVASSSEEMSLTINEVAKNTENARTITGNAVSLAKSASDQVNKLGMAAKEIGKVVESITDISDQVNLLALNATIEAARAGEAGKGFAVVANEIKDLARQTSDATGQIKVRVEGIQSSTETTVSQILDISKIVMDINETVSSIATAVEEQSVTTKEITANIAQASTGISEINENVAQSNTVSGEIAKDIADVTQAAGEISQSSKEVNESAESLSELASKLTAMVGKFKVK